MNLFWKIGDGLHMHKSPQNLAKSPPTSFTGWEIGEGWGVGGRMGWPTARLLKNQGKQATARNRLGGGRCPEKAP